MAIDWVSTGASIIGGLGGMLGGGNKAAERAAKDAAARAQYAQELTQKIAQMQLSPFIDSGTEATKELDYLLGTGGYDVPKPTYEQEYDKLRDAHWKYFGKDYARNSDVAGQRVIAQENYNKALAEWQKGFDAWKAQQGGKDSKFGSLLKSFTEQDLNNDVVYNTGLKFGLDTGTNAIEARARASGSSDSGSVLKELARFGNDYGTTKAADAQGRFMNDKTFNYNALSGQAGRGVGAVGTGLGVSMNTANNIGNSNQNMSSMLLNNSQINSTNQQNALQAMLGNLLYTYKNGRNGGVGTTPPIVTPSPDINNWGYTA